MAEENKPQEGLTAEKLAKALKVNIARALNENKTAGVAKDIRELRQLEKEMAIDRGLDATQQSEPETGIPSRLKIKRTYHLSPEAITARRENARLSTGPITEEGKRRASRNAWKYGGHAASRILGLGKPCKSTCSQYPCELVENGRCAPGDGCLDKEHLLDVCLAIEQALIHKETTGLHELVVFELAESIQLIRSLRRDILEDGTTIKSEKFDADGKVIGYEIKVHPALLALPRLQKDFGISLTDFNLTPAAESKAKADKEVGETIASIFGMAAGGMAAAKSKKKGERE
jgi:hypothetical protein